VEQEHNPNQETPQSTPQAAQENQQPQQKEEEYIDKIIIPMWPKTPVLYPVAIFALICSIVGMFGGMSPKLNQLKIKYAENTEQVQQTNENQTQTEQNQTPTEENQASAQGDNGEGNVEAIAQSLVSAMVVDRILGTIFLILLAFTLFTLCLDMEVRWALVLFTSVIIVLLLIYILNMQFDFLPDILPRIFALSPMATPQFYAGFFLIWFILMLISLVVVQFHYVKIESNEVIVVGGLLERQQRYPTIRMQYVRDIQDVIEYYLPFVNSGRLVLIFPEQRDSVVIDNVLQIDKVTDQLDKLSGVMHVRS